MKKAKNPAGSSRVSRRMKCSCASCQCTVDMSTAYRKGNLVFCSRMCAESCTPEVCRCEHDHCSV